MSRRRQQRGFDYRKFMAFIAILILIAFQIQIFGMMAAYGGIGFGAYVTSPHFIFTIFVILVIYVLAWRK